MKIVIVTLIVTLTIIIPLAIFYVFFFRPPGFAPGQMTKGPFTNLPSPAQAPTGTISVYKGFWMPCSFMDDKCQPMNDVKLIQDMDVNIIGIAPKILINSKGEVNSFPIDFIEKRLNEITQSYYAAGLRIFISPEVDFSEDLNMRGGGEPKPIPAEAARAPGFLDKYDKIMFDIARLAEKYHVEMFSPMNEPDMKVGVDIASSWAQKVLPQIKQNYHGKIMWKVGRAEPQSAGINFVGYDVLGIDFTAPGPPESVSLSNFPQIAGRIIDDAASWAKRDNVPQLILSEVGVWGGAREFSDEGKAAVHKIIFEQGQGKVNGFIILDPPPDQGWSMKGTKTASEIKLWFLEKI